MRPRLPLPALLLLAAGLNLWGLELNGYANEYYSAAVRSMSTSWHAFLYGSFDASGVMTVDKPPLALWIQVASVKVFGFHPLAMLIPQALMGVAAVGLTYDLVRRRFGAAGGRCGSGRAGGRPPSAASRPAAARCSPRPAPGRCSSPSRRAAAARGYPAPRTTACCR